MKSAHVFYPLCVTTVALGVGLLLTIGVIILFQAFHHRPPWLASFNILRGII
jgi:hypothetical protein